MATKVWLITGSSRGFGAALVRAALARGDKVIATARDTDQLQSVVGEYGEQVRTFPLDVTDAAAAGAAV
ncbi:MAG: short-chain alcohol dehydrogenase, partial [Mycobacterium sp.]|nr:short-chain alcohol dehydrogenase [Mycobacterium sp.]